MPPTRPQYPGWALDPDPLSVEPEPEIGVCPVCGWPVGDLTSHIRLVHPPETPRRGCLLLALLLITLAASVAGTPRANAEEPSGAVGTAIYSASATWCAPTPTRCQGWGGNARLAAVNSFRFGDEPYPVRVWRGDIYVDATVVSFCACHGELGYIDLSPAAWTVLEPDLGIGRIDVVVEVLVDLPPHPDDERMRAEDRPLPATDTEETP